MKLSLLEIVQDILNEMDSDEVNSIDDTIESQQVATVVKGCYFELIANRNWPHLRKLIALDSSVDTSKPTHFKIPENMKELIFFRYNAQRPDETRMEMQDVKYMYPDDFLRYVSARNSDDPNIVTVQDASGLSLLIDTRWAPKYWTSFDDTYIICDSYTKAIEDTLQSSKTQCIAYMEPSWDHEDDAVPDLPSEAFPLLVEESKSTAFLVLKQMANQKAEAKAQRQQKWLSRKAWRTHGGVRYQNYGRRSHK
jgi:hypothetical protein